MAQVHEKTAAKQISLRRVPRSNSLERVFLRTEVYRDKHGQRAPTREMLRVGTHTSWAAPPSSIVTFLLCNPPLQHQPVFISLRRGHDMERPVRAGEGRGLGAPSRKCTTLTSGTMPSTAQAGVPLVEAMRKRTIRIPVSRGLHFTAAAGDRARRRRRMAA